MTKTRAICHLCYDCKLSYLMQKGNDPVIALCEKTQDRIVANSFHPCNDFKENNSERIINPMIYCN